MGNHQTGLTAEREGAISQIRPWHREVIRLSAMGKRPSEIALVVDLTECQISKILGSPLVVAEINRLQELADYEAIDMITSMKMRHGKALAAIDRGLAQSDDNKAATIGFELLDRTGFGKTAKHVHAHAHAHVHKDVQEMSDEELLNDVLDITEIKGEENA